MKLYIHSKYIHIDLLIYVKCFLRASSYVWNPPASWAASGWGHAGATGAAHRRHFMAVAWQKW